MELLQNCLLLRFLKWHVTVMGDNASGAAPKVAVTLPYKLQLHAIQLLDCANQKSKASSCGSQGGRQPLMCPSFALSIQNCCVSSSKPFLALLHKAEHKDCELACQMHGLLFYHQLLGTGRQVSFLSEFPFLHLSGSQSRREKEALF